MATYVLVSGAWHAGWCWERIVDELAARGHRALAPDLLGMGPDPTPLSQVSLAAWTDQVAAIVERQDEPVVLVGHSRGGIVISEVAERVPQRIASLVYVAAFLLRSGETLAEAAQKVPRPDVGQVLVPGDDGTTTVDPAGVGPAFYNTTEAAWVERAQARLSPEPMVVFATLLKLTEERFGSVRRAYVECTRDNAVPLELQRLMQAALPCDPVFTLETDHSPFYSAPDQLVDCLLQVR